MSRGHQRSNNQGRRKGVSGASDSNAKVNWEAVTECLTDEHRDDNNVDVCSGKLAGMF
jgi:hypothetical protein